MISGCLYNASSDLSIFAAWLINGTKTVPVSTAEGDTLVSTLTSDKTQGLYKLPDFSVSSVEQFGDYQCILFDPERMEEALLSEKASLHGTNLN